MTNIQEIEKEIMQLQENIEAALNELHKPRGLMAKYAKICQFENEILGPNKDLTNIESEIKEAEEFLSEDQINIIKSIVTDPDISKSSDINIDGSKKIDNDKWNNLRPTLRSLGLVREFDSSKPNENSDSDDSLSDDEDDDNDDEDLDDLDEEDDEDEDNEDHDTDIDLECIRKRRKKFKRKMRNLKRKRLLVETNNNVNITPEVREDIIIEPKKSDTNKLDNATQAPVQTVQEPDKTNIPTTSTSDTTEPEKPTSQGS
jgi:hypothetical protein